MRVLFSGSRKGYAEHKVIERIQELTIIPGLIVIHGAAKGVDSQVDTIARSYGLHVEDYPADWNTHHPDWCPGYWCTKRRYCVGAGPRRNQQMLDTGINYAIFFKKGFDLSKNKGGTEDMFRRIDAAGIESEVHK